MAQSNADVVTGWDHSLAAAEANKEALPFLEPVMTELATVSVAFKDARSRQDHHRAEFQQATRDMERLKARGIELATRLRNGVRTQFGLSSEKLAEFGMQPRRPPQRKKATAKPPEPAPPAQTAPNKTSDVTSV
ncbi:MAG TPA: hypothetical protein VF756_25095 [Thermoanaerobaculia bacterium]